MKHIPRNKGAAIITAVIFFVVISITMAVGLSSPVVREYVTARDFEKSKGAYYLSEAGMEDAVYRLKTAKTIGAQEVISLGGNTATTTITTVNPNTKAINSLGGILRNTRRVKSTVTTTTGESFMYGVWAGAGGVYMSAGATITGNLFSAGPVCGGTVNAGGECSTGSGTNRITGTVISGGTSGTNGTIANIINEETGASMYAGNIRGSTITGNAYCNTISGTTVGGVSTTTCQTLTAQTASDLPITRADIVNWETIATNGGTAGPCSSGAGSKYSIGGDSIVDLGPIKIPCDLEINGNAGDGVVVTLKGPIWVTGNIRIKNKVIIKIDPVLEGQTIVMIADKQSDLINSSTISVEGNNLSFTGAPGGNSWIMLISENNGASLGNPSEAIELEQGAAGDVLLYARQGDIKLSGDASVNEVTGYQITLTSQANVTYSQGLQNALFTSGPGGAWVVQDWKEGQ